LKSSREIRDLVLGWYHDLSGAGDPLEVFSSSEDGVFIGTGPSEYWVGGRAVRAALRLQDDALGSLEVTPGAIQAFEEGSVGWASDQCKFELADGRASSARMTCVFHREDGAWRMVQGHFSHEVSNLDEWGRDLDLSMETIAKLIQQERPDLAPVASPEGTVTIMFTDMEASTATNEAMGDDRFLPLLLRHNEIVRALAESAGGSVVKSQGDGFMLAFASARRSVDCATAIQKEVEALDERIRVRMGIHTGEPVRHSDDFYGRDVAYAARLGAAAAGGEILVSSLVKSLVDPSGSVSFGGPREMELKGFEGPQPVYQVLWRDQAS